MKNWEQIKNLAEIRYGNDPYKYGGQRDGFKEGYKQAQNEQLILSGVIVSGVGKYSKMTGIYDKYTCPICGNTPDTIHPNIQESTCFKDEVKWEYN